MEVRNMSEASQSRRTKAAAMLIATLTPLIAFSQLLDKRALGGQSAKSREASNLWDLFQLRDHRLISIRLAAEQLNIELETATDSIRKAALAKQINAWETILARLDSDSDTHTGRADLAKRTREAEQEADAFVARSHIYTAGSTMFQIGILLASIAVTTGIIWFTWTAGFFGLFGIILLTFGTFAPAALPLIPQL
jgi:Domain of unknown function (DUF4337)